MKRSKTTEVSEKEVYRRKNDRKERLVKRKI